MKLINIVIAISIFYLPNLSFGALPEQPVGGIITENIILNVPDSFSSINEAALWLDGKTILQSAIVTIQVEDGTYNDQDTISINHPCASQIEIIGNVSNPQNVVLNFKNSTNGIFQEDGTLLGLINGFTLRGGASSGSSSGIRVRSNAIVKCGTSMIIENFYRGVLCRWGGYVNVPNAIIRNNDYTGLDCWDATITANGANVSGHPVSGVYAHSKGTIIINNGSVSGSSGYSLNALQCSFILAQNTSIDNMYSSSNSEIVNP